MFPTNHSPIPSSTAFWMATARPASDPCDVSFDSPLSLIAKTVSSSRKNNNKCKPTISLSGIMLISVNSGSEVLKLFRCVDYLSTKLELLKNKLIYMYFSCFKTLRYFILLINVKMPTIVGILTFMSRINLSSA